jgi:hypothetical protein
MKATISADGTLTVRPETELEAFALAQWSNLNMSDWWTDVRVTRPRLMTDCSEYLGAFLPIQLVPGFAA